MSTITSGNFTFADTSIEGVKVIDVKSYGDRRGYFMETYKRPDFEAAGITCDFVQDNQSSSVKGVLRGMHFQIEHPQSKLVRVVRGSVFDVCIDLRPGSPTWGKWEGVVLSAENRRQFFIPRGFAHGFITLTDEVEVQYKADNYYAPECDGNVRWDDPEIGVEWPAEPTILSDKDEKAPTLAERMAKGEINFVYEEMK